MSSSRNGLKEDSRKTEINCSFVWMNQSHGWSCVESKTYIVQVSEDRFTGNRNPNHVGRTGAADELTSWNLPKNGDLLAGLDVPSQCKPLKYWLSAYLVPSLQSCSQLGFYREENLRPSEASTLLPLTTSLALALPLGVFAMATGILVRYLFYKMWRMRKLVGMNVEECHISYCNCCWMVDCKETINEFLSLMFRSSCFMYGSIGIGPNGLDLVRFPWCSFRWKVCFHLLCCWHADQIGDLRTSKFWPPCDLQYLWWSVENLTTSIGKSSRKKGKIWYVSFPGWQVPWPQTAVKMRPAHMENCQNETSTQFGWVEIKPRKCFLQVVFWQGFIWKKDGKGGWRKPRPE